MASPVRLLAALTPKTACWDAAGHGQGGPPSQAQALASGAAAGMPRHWYLAARWKWALDATVATELYETAVGNALKLAIEEGWHSPNARIPDFAELAMAELAWPGSFPNAQARSAWLRIPESSFSRRRRQYESVFQMINGWTAHALGYLHAKTTEIGE